ncbi:MAG: glycosyltransferase family 39 protein, partial [Sphingobium sp.]|nr:glycosyltransferase family 39 protein [Sphingobium sp.]
MSASFVAKTISPSGGRLGILLAMLVISWFAGLALATPFDHDESQYVAGALFSTKMLIFRDFLYLQPPLHAWAYAPVAWAFPTTMVIAMRLVTAMTALGTLAALWAAQRRAGVSRSSATIATLLIATTAAFQFTASVVRNDMLPTLLSSLALLLVMAALRSDRLLYWLGAGLLFGLAIATKLNFAPLGLAVGLFAIANRGRCGLPAAMMLAAGALIGTLPMLLIGAAAPEAFIYGVLHYGAVAPHAWYAANGASDELSLLEKLAD